MVLSVLLSERQEPVQAMVVWKFWRSPVLTEIQEEIVSILIGDNIRYIDVVMKVPIFLHMIHTEMMSLDSVTFPWNFYLFDVLQLMPN